MLHRWIALALLTMFAAGCGVVPLPVGLSDPTAPPPLRAQDAEFRTLAARWFGVWSRDAAAVSEAETLFAREADAQFFDGFMPIEGRFGRDGFSAASRREAFAKFTNFELSPREGVWLRRSGDRAIMSVHFRIAFEGESARRSETDGASTLVCERRGNAWTIVHEHTSFALLEDRLGGEAIEDGASFEHVHPRDPEFQSLIDEYLNEFAESRGADASKADAPARFFAPGADVLVWDPTSRRPLISWASVAAHRDAPDLRVYLTNKTSRGDVRVWKSGDLAWATFTFSARATRRDGDRFEIVGRQTDVFQKIGGAWKIVHEHASVPFGASGTPALPSERVAARSPRTTRSVPKSPTTVTVLETQASKASFDELVAQYASAWSVVNGAFDEKRIAKLYAPEGVVASRTFVDGQPWTYSFRRQMWGEVMQEMTLVPEKDLSVVRRGSVAWTTVTYAAKFQQRDGTQGVLRQFQSAVWEFKDGRFEIQSEHVTVERS
ncbi:MAG: nuclear transport factor 2 family protein [Planctomycetota bacterium]|nr:nuclear transport factor 2 family protein [Planctomycetota bacterium]